MLTFLFWNLNGKRLEDSILRLVQKHKVDVVIVAESKLASGNFLATLNSAGQFHDHTNTACPRIQVFANFPFTNVKFISSSDKFSIFSWDFKNNGVIFATAHLSSLMWQSDADIDEDIKIFADEIRRVEIKEGHERTIVVGDLNSNPFSGGLISARGLHGVSTKKQALQMERKVEGNKWPFMYNPMWRFFGDGTPGPPGTYYYAKGKWERHFWHIFDQVLLRPKLLSVWQDGGLKILSGDDNVEFWDESRLSIDTRVSSDHLPILFQLDLEK